MAHRPWITFWFIVSSFVVLWDAGYCLLRPRSMPGGDLHWLWTPYKIYMDVDYIYGLPAFNEGDGFTSAQAFMNVIECCVNFYYLYLVHVVHWPPADVIGFAGALLTFWKTVLYHTQEVFCGGCNVGHNDLQMLIMAWIVPNGIWLIVPAAIIWCLGSDLIQKLSAKQDTSKKAASQKQE